MKKIGLFFLGTVTAGSLTLGGIALAGSDEPPGLPPWVNSDGSLDESKAPEWQPVMDESGATVGYSKWRDLHQPPPPPGPGAEQRSGPPVKVFDTPAGSHIGWVVPGRGYVKGTEVPPPPR